MDSRRRQAPRRSTRPTPARLGLALAALSLIGAAACFKDLLEQPRAPVYRFSVSPVADTIVAGDTVAPFHPLLTRDQASVPAAITFRLGGSASDSTLGILPGGRLVGRACGVVTLIAEPTSSGLPTSVPDTTVTITVVPARVVATPGVDTLHSISETATLSALSRDSHGSVINCSAGAWTWRSEDTTTAHVSTGGVVTAVRNGTTKIWMRVGLDSDFASVTVAQRTKSVAVSPTAWTLHSLGDTVQYRAVPYDSLNHPIDGKACSWSNSAPGVDTLTVLNCIALARSKAKGAGQITATVDGVTSAPANLTVSQVTQRVDVTPASWTLHSLGDTVRFRAVAYDALNHSIGGKTFTWSTTVPSADTLAPLSGDSTTLATSKANGAAQITATVDGVTSVPANLTVDQVTKRVDLTPASWTLHSLGDTVRFRATAHDSLNRPIVGKVFSWSNSAPGVDTLTPLSGDSTSLARSKANGTGQITATVDGVTSAPANLTVSQVTKSVTLSPTPVTLSYMGATQQLTSTPKDSLGNSIAGRIDHWKSSDTTVATVGAAGLVTAKKIGAVWVVDTVDGVGGRDSVTVRIPAKSLALTPSAASVSGVGASQTFTAVARDTFGTVIAGESFTWASLNPAIATVNGSTAVVTAVSNGQATVSASADGLRAYGLVTVAVNGPAANLLVNLASGTAQPLTDVWGASPTNVYAVGGGGTVLHFDGLTWATEASGNSAQLRNVWGASDTSIFVVGYNGTILRWDGTSWGAQSSGTAQNLRGVWGSSPRNVFAVGAGGTILHWDGSSWAAMSSPTTQNLLRVWGTSDSNAFAVGDNGTVVRWDGAIWTAQASGVTNNLYSVWGTSPSDVFAAGDGGTILHWNGTSWAGMTSGTTQVLSMVWGTSPTNVYAVAEGGAVLRWDGSSWNVLASTGGLYGVGGASPMEFYVVGPVGTLLRALAGATVTVTPANPTLTAIGATQQLTATARDASGNALSGVSYTWSSSDATVATVSTTGLVTAVANGTATIAATAPGGAAATATLTVSPPAIAVTPSSLSFNWQVGSSGPPGQTLGITNAGGGTVAWTATRNSTWLNLSPASGTAPSSVTVAIATSGLNAGPYRDTIWLSATGASNSPLPVPVTLTVIAQPVIALSPTSLSFTGLQGGASPTSQSVSVTNSGGGNLSWTGSTDQSWLSISPAGGTAPSTVTVSASTAGLSAGTYNGTVTISASGASNTPQPVPVTLTVLGPSISLSPTSLSFSGQQGGANPASQSLSITNTGGESLTWNASSNQTWLTVAPSSGTAPSTPTVSVSTSGLSANSYTGTITVAANGASNSPQPVPVTLTVLPLPPVPPSNLSARVINSNEIDLSWMDNSTNEAGFQINWCTGNGGCSPASLLGSVGSNTASYRHTGIQANTVYCYAVVAYNAGGSSTASASACAGTYSLTPSADATVFNYTPDNNYGASTLMYVQSSSSQNQYAASLVRFNLSMIPQNATIENAYLNLYPYSVSGPPTLRIQRLVSTTSWTETGVTWNNMPYADGNFAASYLPVSSGAWNVDGVTTFVQAWVSQPSTNNGFQLFTETNGASAGFYTRESGATGPTLSLVFHSP